MNVAIIDYGAGNILSVKHAMARLGIQAILTSQAEEIRRADRVVFPGVGEARSAMSRLRSHGLDKVIPGLRQPVLGICLGLQLMCTHTTEQDTPGLAIFSAKVKKFSSGVPDHPVPHMGWNTIRVHEGKGGLPAFHETYFFFVHSYYAEVVPETLASCDYLHPFSAILNIENFTGVQFHPEKSGKQGEHLLRLFLENKLLG